MKPITSWQEQLAENMIRCIANKCNGVSVNIKHTISPYYKEMLTNNTNCSFK